MTQHIDFSTPHWLDTTWTISGWLTVVGSSYGMYVIWFQSTKEMLQYKHFLSAIVALTTMFDFTMNFLLRPVALFPLWGGFSDGTAPKIIGRVMKMMGILDGDATYLTPIIQLLCFEAIVALVCGFLFRYGALQTDHWALRTLFRQYGFSLLVHIPTAFPCPIFCALARSPRADMITYIREKHPGFSAIVNHSMWVILDPDIGQGNPWSSIYGYCCLFMCTVYLSIGGFTLFLIVRKLNQMKGHMSEKTYRLHKNLLVALCWQSLIPIVMYFVPLLVGLLVIRFNFTGSVQDWMNHFSAMMGSHAIINVILMVYFTKPYREFTIRLLNRVGLFKKETTADVVPISTVSSKM